jgi:TetR/AcrR family transcriptional regulator, regulator of mycofactocin system
MTPGAEMEEKRPKLSESSPGELGRATALSRGLVGRRPATTRAEIEHVALDLFARNGFEATTVDDVAEAAGIGRRTFFRYYASKNDVPWGEFDATLERMRAFLVALPADLALMDALRTAVLDFNRLEPGEEPWHRQRMALILRVPALQAHSMLKYREWRQVVAEYAAARLALPATDLVPQALGWSALGVAIAAYECWLESDGADLAGLLDAGYRRLAEGFGDRQPGHAGQGGTCPIG